MPSKQLSVEELESLKKWLKEHQITWSTRIHREMSDSLAVATLLKKFYPKMIDLHNYPARNNTQLKLDNWETLNLKVLIKIGLQQTKATLGKLSKSTPGAIDSLLFEIMQHEKANHREEKPKEQEKIWSDNDDIMIVTVNKKVGDAIIQVPQKMILFSIYEEAVRESQSKDSYISASEQKIAHFENILKLKGDRIDELGAQLAKQSVRIYKKNYIVDTANTVLPIGFDSLMLDDLSGQSSSSI